MWRKRWIDRLLNLLGKFVMFYEKAQEDLRKR